MPTSASEYRKACPRTFEVKLPSGNEFRLQRPPLGVWLMKGALPSFFAAEVRDAWAQNSAEMVADAQTSVEYQARNRLISEALVIYACLEPKVKEEAPQDGELSIEDLAMADLTFLSNWVWSGSPGVAISSENEGMGVEDLRSFHPREEGVGVLPTGPDGGAVRSAAEQAARG